MGNRGNRDESKRKTFAAGPRRWLAGFSLALAGSAVLLAGQAPAAGIPPLVEAKPALAVAGGFEMKATIYTYELDTHYRFEYGTTTSYGTSLPVPDGDAGSAAVAQVAQTATGVQPNATYHYRVFASNSAGPGMSADQTFTTAADLGSPPPPSPQPAPGPGPSAGEPSPAKGGKLRVGERRLSGHQILTAANGHTLYSLSAEQKGKFVCTRTSGCLSIWHPLLVPRGATLAGPVKLGTIARPEGGRQATYRGRPLYTFGQDQKPGQARGEGLKDVGTWHAARVKG
jgi:predicted lipoprotein with Yx(FWY)xxD motif